MNKLANVLYELLIVERKTRIIDFVYQSNTDNSPLFCSYSWAMLYYPSVLSENKGIYQSIDDNMHCTDFLSYFCFTFKILPFYDSFSNCNHLKFENNFAIRVKDAIQLSAISQKRYEKRYLDSFFFFFVYVVLFLFQGTDLQCFYITIKKK